MFKIVKTNKRLRKGGKRAASARLERTEGKWVVHYEGNNKKVFKDEDYKPGKSKRHAERFMAKVS